MSSRYIKATNVIVYPSANAVDGGQFNKEEYLSKLEGSTVNHVIQTESTGTLETQIAMHATEKTVEISTPGACFIDGRYIEITTTQSDYVVLDPDICIEGATAFIILQIDKDGADHILGDSGTDCLGVLLKCVNAAILETIPVSDYLILGTYTGSIETGTYAMNDSRFKRFNDTDFKSNTIQCAGVLIENENEDIYLSLTKDKIELKNRTNIPSTRIIADITDPDNPVFSVNKGAKNTTITDTGIETINGSVTVSNLTETARTTITKNGLFVNEDGQFGSVNIDSKTGIDIKRGNINISSNATGSATLTAKEVIVNKHMINLPYLPGGSGSGAAPQYLTRGTPIGINTYGNVVPCGPAQTLLGVYGNAIASSDDDVAPTVISGITPVRIDAAETITPGDTLIPAQSVVTPLIKYFTPGAFGTTTRGVVALEGYTPINRQPISNPIVKFGLYSNTNLDQDRTYQIRVSKGYTKWAECTSVTPHISLYGEPKVDTVKTTQSTFHFTFDMNIIKTMASGEYKFMYYGDSTNGTWYNTTTRDIVAVVNNGDYAWTDEFTKHTGLKFGTSHVPLPEDQYIPANLDKIVFTIGKTDQSIADGTYTLTYNDSTWVYDNNTDGFALIDALVVL